MRITNNSPAPDPTETPPASTSDGLSEQFAALKKAGDELHHRALMAASALNSLCEFAPLDGLAGLLDACAFRLDAAADAYDRARRDVSRGADNQGGRARG